MSRAENPFPSVLTTLQAGRALAALAVAAFHLSITVGDRRYLGEQVFDTLTHRGSLGVDFFFVLSGFIILHAHRRDVGVPGSLGRYAWKRFARVFPIYWLYTAVFAILVGLGFGTAAVLPHTGEGWLQAFTLIRVTPETPPLPVAWTLFHEVAFYIVFGLFIANFRVGLLAFAAWMVACLWMFQQPDEKTPLAVYTAAYNLNFLFGMLAYIAAQRIMASHALGVLAAGLAALACVYTLDHRGAIDGAVNAVLFGISFAVIVAGLASAERHNRLKAPGWLTLTGDASYTIYLIHQPVQGLVAKIALLFGAQHLGAPIFYIVVFFISAGACVGAYLLVERPLLRALGRRTPRPKLSAAPGLTYR